MSQGSIIGPLFILVFNDVAYCTKGASKAKYAKDSVNFIVGKKIKEMNAILSKVVAELLVWFSENETILNLARQNTEALSFRKPQRTRIRKKTS